MTRSQAQRFPLVAWVERRTSTQRHVGIGIAAVFAVVALFRMLARLVLDLWWFRSVGAAEVWRVRSIAKLQLFVGAGVVMVLTLGVSLILIVRIGRRVLAPNNRAMRWYHDRMGPAHTWLLVGVSTYLGLRGALGLAADWREWVQFKNGSTLGVDVPVTGHDLGRYLFSLPFESMASRFVRLALLTSLVVSVIGHSFSGALRWSKSARSRRAAVAHVASLLAALTLSQSLHHLFVARPMLALERSGGFVGAGYTESTFRSPGLMVAGLSGLVVSGSLVWFVAKRHARPFIVSASIAVGIHVVAIVLAPFASEKFIVEPARGDRELTAFAHNLDATRFAFGLGAIGAESRSASETLDDALTSNEVDLVERTPIFDPEQMVDAFQILNGTQGTRISSVDLDRYVVNGETRPVLIGARQPDRSGLPATGWVNEHLVYTNGDGVAVAFADEPDINGRPDLAPAIDGIGEIPATYFGEGLDGWWVVVGTKREQIADASYSGDAGISVSTAWRRLIAAAALDDHQIFLSGEFTSDSQLLMRRGLKERLSEIAPFLRWDSDPYPVVADGHAYWMVDGYTYSSTFPFSSYVDVAAGKMGGDPSTGSVNYLRLAVRAVVDASSGETSLYRVETGEDDPVLDLWIDVFPDLIESEASFPENLRDHARYPVDLFVTQSELLGRYHVTDAEDLFNGSDRWSVSPEPSTSIDAAGSSTMRPVRTFTIDQDGNIQWALVSTYSRGSSEVSGSIRDELSAVIVALDEFSGDVRLTRLGSVDSSGLSSPRMAQSAIAADPEVAQSITLLNANGSKVSFGPMAPLLLEDEILWARSIVVKGTGPSSVPRFNEIVVVANGEVWNARTAKEAIVSILDRR